MKNKIALIILLIIPICISCSSYSTEEEKSINKVLLSIQNEQKNISLANNNNKRSVIRYVGNGGNKPYDIAVQKVCLEFSKAAESTIAQVDSLLKKENISKENILLLEDSLKSLERKINPMDLPGNAKEEKALLKQIRLLFFPALLEQKNISSKMQLSMLKNQLLYREYNVARESVMSVASCDLTFLILYPLVLAKSETVEEGDSYKGNLFLGSGTYIPMEVKLNKQLIKDSSRVYYIQLPSSKNNFDSNGLCKKTWELDYSYYNRESMQNINCHLKTDYYVRRRCQ